MANGTEIGSAWISILPDLSGLGAAVSKGMKTASTGAAKAFTAGMKSNLGGVSKAFSEAGKDAGEALAKSALSAAKSDINKLSKQVASATDAQATALGRLRVAQAKLTEVQGTAGAKASSLAAAEEAVAAAQRKANVATGAADGFTKKLAEAQGKAKTAADDLAKAQSSAGESAKRSGSKAAAAFSDAFRGGFNAKKTADENFSKIDGNKAGRGVATRFGVGFNGLFGGIISKSAGLLAATFATVGIGNLVKDSVGLEASFSQTMNTMAAAAKVPADGIKSLSDLAIQLGADTTYSAGEAATAMLELAKGGLDAATIKSGALAGTLTLAAAGGTSLETAATIASNALNTFSLKGSDMAAVAAAMAGGANASSASVESLGQALQQVGPGASNAGLSLQETVAVLSSFDAAGIKGSDAGTSLKTMLTRLVPSTDKAKGAMEDLGLSFTDASGNFLPITNIAQQLQDKLSGLSDEQQTLALSTIFGSDATRAATVLMKEGATGVQKFINATNDQNAANEVAAARMSGTAGAIESFKGSLETAKLRLGQFIAPAVQGGLKTLTGLINNIAPAVQGVAAILGKGDFTKNFRNAFHVEEDSPVVAFLLNLRSTVISVFGEIKTRVTPAIQAFSRGFQNLVPFVASFAANLAHDLLPPVIAVAKVFIGLALILVGKVAGAFQAVTGFMKDNATLVQSLAVGIGAIVLAMKAYQLTLAATALVGKGVLLFTKAWTLAQAALNFVLDANPIGIIVLALVGLAVGLVYAYKHSETFRNIVNGVFNSVKGVALAVFGAIKVGVAAVVTAFFAVKNAIGTAIGAIVTAFNAVKSAVSTAISFVASVFGTIVAAVMVPVNTVVRVLGAIWSRVYPILVLPFYIARTVINGIVTLILAGLTAAKNWVVGVFAKAWAAVSGVLAGPIRIAKTAIGTAWAGITAAFTAAKNWVVGVFAKAWAAVKETILGPVRLAKAAVATAWTGIRNGFTSAKDWVTGAFSKSWATVTAKLSKPISDAKAAISSALGATKGGLQWVFKNAVSAIGKIWDGLQVLAKAPIKFIVNTVLNDGLIGAFNWVANKFQAPTIAPIPLPKGFASGGEFSGRLPGPPSAVDNMLGTHAGRAVGLASGEFITNAKDTQRALPLLKHINSGGSLPGFADGGLFGKLKSVATGAFNAGKSFGEDVYGVLKDPVKWFKDRLAGPLNRMSELGNSPVAEVVKQVPRNLVDTVAGKAKDLLGIGGGGFNANLGGVLDFVRAHVGNPYVWGGVGPNGFDCSGLVSAAINVAMGRKPFSRIGATGSMPWSMFESGPGAFEVGWFQGNPGHTAATVNGTNIESSGGRGVHMGPGARGAHDALFTNRAHVKGFANGGLLGDPPFDLLSPRGKAYVGKNVMPNIPVFDAGGTIAPGINVIDNQTGRAEALRPVDQELDLSEKTIAAFAAALDGMRVEIGPDGAAILSGAMVRTADSRIAESNRNIKRRVGTGRTS